MTLGSTQKPGSATRPFSAFEWMIAGRYLRARRKDTFISVIASLTLVGVAIGVATLIVVTSVMNGFREELLSKILGLNGHFTVYPIESKFTDYKDDLVKWEKVAGVTHAVAFVEGEALASGFGGSTGVSVRGMDLSDIKKLNLLYDGVSQGGWDDWDSGEGAAIGYRLAQKLGISVGGRHHHRQPERYGNALRDDAADPLLPGQCHIQPRHGRVRQLLRLSADEAGTGFFQAI